ncbi:MAG TPA: SH3 domain-containing protein, partial [Myxococcota bacterium]|nr:SH3 domain-containing protein [Myxococcota bacterium]
ARAEELRVVTGTGLRVRSAPDTTSEVLEKLELGATAACLGRVGEAVVGEKKGAFCRTRLADGREGFFFEALTGPFDPARPEDAWRAIVDERTAALEYCAEKRKEDVWGFQRFLLARAAAATGPGDKARWELAELRLIKVQACLYLGGDARVYRDESQGARLRREALWSFVDRVQGTPASEQGAWLAVEHGHDFECEGYLPCYLAWKRHVEAEYLRRFPDGPHAQDAARGIGEAARPVLAALEKGELGREDLGANDLETLAVLRGALAAVKGDQARAVDGVLAQIEARVRAFGAKAP